MRISEGPGWFADQLVLWQVAEVSERELIGQSLTGETRTINRAKAECFLARDLDMRAVLSRLHQAAAEVDGGGYKVYQTGYFSNAAAAGWFLREFMVHGPRTEVDQMMVLRTLNNLTEKAMHEFRGYPASLAFGAP